MSTTATERAIAQWIQPFGTCTFNAFTDECHADLDRKGQGAECTIGILLSDRLTRCLYGTGTLHRLRVSDDTPTCGPATGVSQPGRASLDQFARANGRDFT